MPKAKLTKHLIEGIKPTERDQFYWDTETSCLALKVTPAGRKVFMVQYRVGGRGTPTRKVFLGQFGSYTLHQARQEAARIIGQRAEGRDPAKERKEQRRKTVENNIADVVAAFLKRHASQNRSFSETKRIFERELLPRWKARSIHDITRRDIIKVIDDIAERGSPIMANRTLAAIRKMFNWALSRGIIDTSSCNGIAAPSKESSRSRVLFDDELRSIILAVREANDAFGAIIELLALTGQRRSEVSEMTWNEVDLENGIWTIPEERSKNGRPHTVHLSDQALSILNNRPRLGAYVFTTNGTSPFQGFRKAKDRLDKRSGVTGWRIHDIRRTVTSGLARLGISPHVADKILNHQSGAISGVAAVYQRHDFLTERKTAIDVWGRHVQALISGVALDNVVSIGAVRHP